MFSELNLRTFKAPRTVRYSVCVDSWHVSTCVVYWTLRHPHSPRNLPPQSAHRTRLCLQNTTILRPACFPSCCRALHGILLARNSTIPAIYWAALQHICSRGECCRAFRRIQFLPALFGYRSCIGIISNVLMESPPGGRTGSLAFKSCNSPPALCLFASWCTCASVHRRLQRSAQEKGLLLSTARSMPFCCLGSSACLVAILKHGRSPSKGRWGASCWVRPTNRIQIAIY